MNGNPFSFQLHQLDGIREVLEFPQLGFWQLLQYVCFREHDGRIAGLLAQPGDQGKPLRHEVIPRPVGATSRVLFIAGWRLHLFPELPLLNHQELATEENSTEHVGAAQRSQSISAASQERDSPGGVI